MEFNHHPGDAMPATPRLIVIGHGMVGQRLLEELARQRAAYQITVFCEEPCFAYDRIRLSECFDGDPDLALANEDFFRDHGITVLRGQAATGVDRVKRCVYTADGQAYPYDRLVLAMGAIPYIPPTEGYGQPHCLQYRTLRDVDTIKQSAQGSRRGVVIGYLRHWRCGQLAGPQLRPDRARL